MPTHHRPSSRAAADQAAVAADQAAGAAARADSASELQAAASLFGSFCVDANLAFYEQKKKDPHPLACEAASKDVKACWDSL